ncbi:MAG: glycine dehydrogenase (aminomethyl-transferring) [Dictyoglomus sp. NZ13-RE01]|nr:MAG: glycine dehydrogenase (aminomethyl-transferring) [Dictyoglomus sp. NZ13-RE01]
MTYFPHTKKEIEEMLKEIGVESIEELFLDIPEEIRELANKNFLLPPPISEIELKKEILNISQENKTDFISFIGGGAYNHYIPPVVKEIISYPSFYTSYTPYQPEISQGFLQAMFEYQSLICDLTGMDVANASLYEAGSGTAESALMAYRINGRKDVIISEGVHPEYKEVLRTYLKSLKLNIKEIPLNERGETDLNKLKEILNENTSSVIIQNPNFFGVIEKDIDKISGIVHENNSLLISIVYPISLGILKPPKDYNADVVVGEGQALGNSLNFGGPYLGIFATKKEFIRQIPGRIVGETIDKNGKRGFVLTLQAREQHIRRAKATSNICSNEALTALASTVYLSLLGKKGLKRIAEICFDRAHYAHKKLSEIPGIDFPYSGYFFNEFVIRLNKSAKDVYEELMNIKILPGVLLSNFYPVREKEILLAFTEMNSKEEINYFVNKLREVLR